MSYRHSLLALAALFATLLALAVADDADGRFDGADGVDARDLTAAAARIAGGSNAASRRRFDFFVSVRVPAASAVDRSKLPLLLRLFLPRTLSPHVCGGVVVGSRLVLTASHCTRVRTSMLGQSFELRLYASLVTVAIGPRSQTSGLGIRAARVLVHEAGQRRADLALIQLRSDIPKPRRMPATLWRDGKLPTGTFFFLGLGHTRDADPLSTAALARRLQVMGLRPVPRAARWCGPTRGRLWRQCLAGLRGASVCSRDSGGPVVQRVGKGDGAGVRVVGVVSSIVGRCGDARTRVIMTRVAPFRAALSARTLATVARGGTPAPWKVLRVPRPCLKRGGLQLALCS